MAEGDQPKARGVPRVGVVRSNKRARVYTGLTQQYRAEYTAWDKMLHRCSDPNNIGYEHYGQRGISVCERWMLFANFFEDMGPRPSAQHSLDRIDNNGNYCPKNCKWSTRTEQNRNMQRNVHVELDGASMLLIDAMKALGIFPHGFYHRTGKFKETHQQVVDHYAKLRRSQGRW